MATILGAALTPAVLDAWTAAYWQLANIMIEKEKAAYDEPQRWTTWKDFKIDRIVPESDEISSFFLEPCDGQQLPDYLPGQYLSVQVDVPQFHYQQSRQYSLSDAPRQDCYRISVKKDSGLDPTDPTAPSHPGWVSNILYSEKRAGDIVQVSCPAGDFFWDPTKDQNCPIVLLSAGVGITPMVSILNTLVQRHSKQPISFIHGSRNTSVQAFGQHIRRQAQEHENIHAVTFIKSPVEGQDVKCKHYHQSGRLSLEKLDSELDLYLRDPTTKYFVCGPDRFMVDVKRDLKALGVEGDSIRMVCAYSTLRCLA